MTRHSSLSMHALQRADKLLGWICCAGLQPVRWLTPLGRLLPPRPPSRRVLMMKFWGIGSLQLLTPSVRTLRWRHPGTELVLLTLLQNLQAAEALGVFDRVITLDVEAARWSRVLARILRLMAALRRERFDEVYDFEFFTRFSALMTLATGSRSTHGFATSRVWRGAFHRRQVLFNRYWHVARNFRLLAGGENGRAVDPADLAPPSFSAADEARVGAALRAAGLSPGAPYAVLNPNAGALSLERRWPAPCFGELAARLALEGRLAVVLIGSRGERPYTEQVRELSGERARGSVVDLAGELSTKELAALLARAAVVVSNDSGPMHLAAALGAPTVGLFGPETPVMYAPLGERTRALYRPTPCSPCINVHDNKFSSCVFGYPQCLVNIPVDDVLDAARALMREDGLDLAPPARPVEPWVRRALPHRLGNF